MTLRLLYILLLCAFALTASAQVIEEKNFTLYSIKNGLSSDYITAVEQDAYGYLWISTIKGLNRFDGSSFQQFYADSNKNSLPEDWIHRLKLLDKEQIAALTYSGLHIINYKTLKNRNLIVPPDSLKNPIPVNNLRDVLSDKNGNIFILTLTGFYQFDNTDKLVFRYDHYSKKDLQNKVVRFGLNMIKMGDHTIFLATDKGLYIYNILRKELHPVGSGDDEFYRKIAPKKRFLFMHSDENSFSIKMEDGDELFLFDLTRKKKYRVNTPPGIVEQFYFDSKLVRLNDTVFVINNLSKGLYLIQYDRATDSYNLTNKKYFEDYTCCPVLVDKNKHLWVGTRSGLLQEKRLKGNVEQITLSQSDHVTGANTIGAIAIGNDKVFIGTDTGMLVFDKNSFKLLKQINISQSWPGVKDVNIVNHSTTYKDTLFCGWAGAWINMTTLTQGKIIFYNRHDPGDIRVLFRDTRNIIYISKMAENTFYYKQPNADKFIQRDFGHNPFFKPYTLMKMDEDPRGNLWFSNPGISRFNYSSQKFDILLDSFPSIKVRRKTVTSNLVFDNNGNIYFGVYDNGLIIYDPVKKKFSQLTRNDGLPDNIIRALCLVQNKLWIGTDSGLANYDLLTKRISFFGVTENIPIESNNYYLLEYDTAYHQLYAAFNKTIIRFTPDKLVKNSLPPIFFIENISTGKETIHHAGNKIELSYKHNNLVINLASINFEDAYQQQFAYRLVKDGNEAWQETGSQRSIIFSNLPPGQHHLQVKVYTRNNSWPSQVKEIAIVILPPFWKTVWFYILIALLIVSFAYYLHRKRINQVLQKANIDNLLAQTEMKALHSQMNPHFIFNCLNSIREMILNNENNQASLYLSKFARLIRITLDHSSKQFVSLGNTVDYLDRYLEMERIRTNFSYTITIDENLQPDEIFLPPMLIQPFIENAIWHGALPEKNMEVHVNFRKKENELICIVEDNGIGIEESLRRKKNMPHETSVGIANIRQRIQVLNEKYNLQSTIRIEDKSVLFLNNGNGTGTIVTLRLPIKTNETIWTA